MSQEALRFDVVVIGGGMAGASAAAFISEFASVALLEAETVLGYHATGRSAAVLAPNYGSDEVRRLTDASRAFFSNPPDGFAASEIVKARGILYLAREDQLDTLRRVVSTSDSKTSTDVLATKAAREYCPLIRSGIHAVYDGDLFDIDVDLLLQGFVRILRSHNGKVFTTADVKSLERKGGVWDVRTANAVFETPVIVNAAGAWSDWVAKLAGLSPIGLTPRRRTAIVFSAPDGVEVSAWPMLLDVDEQFYLKPEAGRLLASPGDETEEQATDTQADDLDIATAADRVMTALDINIRRIAHKWAGQRTFAPDRNPVIGFDPRTEGFVWSAGQGGYGIQTAPAWGQAVARCLQDGSSGSTGVERLLSRAQTKTPLT